MAEEIKQSMGGVQVIGLLKEMNLTREGVQTRELKYNSGIKENCNAISKTNFKSPAFVIEVNGQCVEVDLGFGVNELKVDKDGKTVPNDAYKALETVIDTYECGKTRVKLEGNIKPNEYVAKDGNWHTYAPKIDYFKITSTNVPDEDSVEGTVTGILSSHTEESFGEDKKTGRIKVRIWSFDYAGKMYPIDLFVPKTGVTEDGEEFEFAEAFEEYVKTNDQLLINVTAVVTQHGSTQKKSVGLGRSSKRVSGYTTQELIATGVSKIFENEDAAEEADEEFDATLAEYFVPSEFVAEASEARKVMIAKKEAEKAGETTSTSTVKGSASQSSNPFGGSNPFA